MPWWARAIVGVALVRIAVPLTLYLSGLASRTTPAPLPVWAYAFLGSTFAALGLMLVAANRRDPRASWLGGVLLLIAALLVWPVAGGAGDPRLMWMARVRPDAFLPLFLWHFVDAFSGHPSGAAHTRARVMIRISAIAGVAAAAANLSFLVWPESPALDPWRARLSAEGVVRNSFYWPAVLLLDLSAFVDMLFRLRGAAPEERGRIQIFVTGLVAGSLPLIVEIALEQLIPAYARFAHQPRVEPWIGLVGFGALAIVPFVTAYSVLFDRIVDIRVALHAAIQYALGRYSIIGLTSVPFIALLLFVVQRRAESLTTLLTGVRPLVLGSAAILGLLALRLRRRWLAALDKRFFREGYDPRLFLARLMTEQRHAASAEDLAFTLRHEIDRALHVQATLFIRDEGGELYFDPAGRQGPLAATSALASLVFSSPEPFDIDLDPAQTPLRRLRDEELRWLQVGAFRLLIPLRAASGHASGMLALSAKRSGLRYSDDDRRLLSAVGAAIGLELENLKLRSTPAHQTDPPARECADCRRLNPPDAACCTCGGKMFPGSVPYTLRGVFRFEQRIGAGGMGVVYRAADLSLGRAVAIKTLPRLGPEQAARLRKEARAMASLSHPNLAVVYSVETWQDTPFIVEEYLGGGTLSTRLSLGPIRLSDALDLGIVLAGAVGALHAVRIIHCDIKPSNIGFTAAGVVKLLDFGLARLLRDVAASADGSTHTGVDRAPRAAPEMSEHAIAGTPLYMAPEAFRGEKPRPSFDLWGLNAVLYEAIAGQRPYSGVNADHVHANIAGGALEDIRAFCPGCPEELSAYFSRALGWDAATRPPDAAALTQELLLLRTLSG